MAKSFEVESVVREYNVYKDVWSAADGTLPCQQERFLFEEDDLANCKSWQNVEQYPYSAESLATLTFSSTENFSYMPCVTIPFSIMVSTTGFMSSLIASI